MRRYIQLAMYHSSQCYGNFQTDVAPFSIHGRQIVFLMPCWIKTDAQAFMRFDSLHKVGINEFLHPR